MGKVIVNGSDLSKVILKDNSDTFTAIRIYYGPTMVYTQYRTITFAISGDPYNLGSWSNQTMLVPFGGSISRSGRTITIKDHLGNTFATNTLTITNPGGQYSSTVTYTNDSQINIVSDFTVTATISTVLVGWTVSMLTDITNPNYGSASWDSSTISVTDGTVIEISIDKKTITFYQSDAITVIGTRVLTTTLDDWCSLTSITLKYQIQGSPEWSNLVNGQTITSDMSIKAFVVFGSYNWTPYDTHSYNGVYDDIEFVLDDAYSHGRAAYLHCTNDGVSPTRWYFDTIGRDLTFNVDLPQCISGWNNIDEVDDDFQYAISNMVQSTSYAYLYIPSGTDDTIYYLYYRAI